MTYQLPQCQPADAHHLAVGNVVITTLFDTTMQATLDLVTQIGPDEAAELHRLSRRASPPCITVNAYLVQTPDSRILIDAGLGANADANNGRARRALEQIGLSPSDIDLVLLTHLHPDHFGGLLDGDGQPVFPNAPHRIPGGEINHWQAGPPADADETAQRHFAGAQTFLEACHNQIERLDGHDAASGITRVELPGHTPDHSGYRIESAGETLLIWGDIVHLPQIQFPQPKACVAFDTDPYQAQRTRHAVMAQVAESGEPVAGHHIDFPGIGTVNRDGDGYRFQPHVWSASV